MTPEISDESAESPDINSKVSIAAVSYAAAVGALLFNTLPVLLGALSTTMNLDVNQQATFASVGLMGTFVTILTAVFWVRRVDWRKITVACTLLAVSAWMLMLQFQNYDALLVLIFFVGVFNAGIYAPAIACLGDTTDSTRAFSAAITLQVLVAALSLYIVPAILVPTWGFAGVIVLNVLLTAVLLPLSFLLPRFGAPSSPRTQEGPDANHKSSALSLLKGARMPMIGLGAMALFYLGLNGAWAFLEFIGTSADLAPETIGFGLSISMIVGAAGAFMSGVIGDRYGRTIPLVVTSLLFFVFVIAIRMPQTGLVFAVALIIFNIGWNFGISYQLSIIAKSDITGKLFVLIPAAQTIGGVFGPIVTSAATGKLGLDGVYIILIGSVVVSHSIYILLDRKLNYAA